MTYPTEEDIAHTANVLRDHFPLYISGTCLCGEPIVGPPIVGRHDWAVHVAEIVESVFIQ